MTKSRDENFYFISFVTWLVWGLFAIERVYEANENWFRIEEICKWRVFVSRIVVCRIDWVLLRAVGVAIFFPKKELRTRFRILLVFQFIFAFEVIIKVLESSQMRWCYTLISCPSNFWIVYLVEYFRYTTRGKLCYKRIYTTAKLQRRFIIMRKSIFSLFRFCETSFQLSWCPLTRNWKILKKKKKKKIFWIRVLHLYTTKTN